MESGFSPPFSATASSMPLSSSSETPRYQPFIQPPSSQYQSVPVSAAQVPPLLSLEGPAPATGSACGRVFSSTCRGLGSLIGVVTGAMYTGASFFVPNTAKRVFDPAYETSNVRVENGARAVGRTLVAGATALAAYGTYRAGNAIVDSSVYLSQAVPGFTQTVWESGWILRAGSRLDTIIKVPSQLKEIPYINTFGHGLVAVSAVIAATTLVAHCATGNAKETATKVGRYVSGAIALHATQAVCEKVISMPNFVGLTVARNVYTYTSQMPLGKARLAINILASAAVAAAGVTTVCFRATAISAGAAFASVVSPTAVTALASGTVAVYGMRAVDRRIRRRSFSIRLAVAAFTFTALAYGVSVGAPLVAGLAAQKVVLLTVPEWAANGLSAMALVATAGCTYKTFTATAGRTARYSHRAIALGAAVAAGAAVSFAAVVVDSYSPVSIAGLFFVYQCSQVGKVIGAKVGGAFEAGERRGACVAEAGPMKFLVGVSAVIGHYKTVAFGSSEPIVLEGGQYFRSEHEDLVPVSM